MVLANSAESAGNDLLAPTSRSGGGCSTIWRVPPTVAPAQLRIHTVSWSAQAESLASQQLCPPPTLVTMREAAGLLRSTTVLASA